MGKLTYDSSLVMQFDDRVLAHLQLVFGAKLRRNESFFFSWRDGSHVGDTRSTIWVSPSISLCFRFSGGRPPAINRSWVDELMASANSSAGLHITPEPHSPSSGELRHPGHE